MNKSIGLRFLLEHGQFLQVVLVEDKALEILTEWLSPSPPSRKALGELLVNGGWAVRTERIVAIHTFDSAAAQASTPAPQRLPDTMWGASGLPGM